MPYNRSISAPNLPAAPTQYEQRYQDQLNNVLRLFFNGVTNSTNSPKPFGSYYDTTTQTNPVANIARPITLNSTVIEFGMKIGAPTSRIYVSETGNYNIQFSAQADKTGGGADALYIWLRVNGADIPYTNSKVVISGPNAETIPAWNFVINLRANDYFELVWLSPDTNMVLAAVAPTTFGSTPTPGIPSVILTVTWVSAEWI